MGSAQGIMLVLRPVNVKCIQVRSYGVATKMGGWGLLHMSIHIELVIHLLAHRRSLHEDFEHNITTITEIIVYKYVSPMSLAIFEIHERSHSMSRASHAVEVDPDPNLPMT